MKYLSSVRFSSCKQFLKSSSVMLALLLLHTSPALSATVCTNWASGAGSWTDSASWDSGIVPNDPSANVCISSGGPVTLSGVGADASSLSVTPGVLLNIGPSANLSIYGGNIFNGGAIDIVGGSGGNAALLQNSGILQGSGIVRLVSEDGGAAYVSALTDGATLENHNTLEGAGYIGDGNRLNLTNDNTINANVAGHALSLNNAGGTFTNNGTFEATNGGILELNRTIINDGTLQAVGGTVDFLDGVYVRGGTLATTRDNEDHAGVLETRENSLVYLDGVSLSAGSVLAVNRGASLFVINSINNDGEIDVLGGYGGDSMLQFFNGGLYGTGTVRLSAGEGGGAAYLSGAGSTTLYNTNTIEGWGYIGDGSALNLINFGTINADVEGKALSLNKAGGTFTNTGTFEATNGGILEINNKIVNHGTIEAAGGTVDFLNGSDIVGGSLASGIDGDGDSGILQVRSGAYTTFESVELLSGSTLTINKSSSATIVNSMTNNGEIDVLGGNDGNATLIFNTGVLNGNGTIKLSSGGGWWGAAYLSAATDSTVLYNYNTIEGAGYIGSVYRLNFRNYGTVHATGDLNIGPAGGTFVNFKNVSVDSGASLTVAANNYTYVQKAGTTQVDGSLVALNGVNIQGGTLQGTGDITGTVTNYNGGIVHAGNSPGTLTITGNYTQFAGASLSMSLTKSAHSLLDVGGLVTLDGNLDLDIDTGKSFSGDTLLTLITAGDGITGNFSSFSVNGTECSSGSMILCTLKAAKITFSTIIDNNKYMLQNLSVTSVPLPAALPLFALGLSGFGLMSKRRRMAQK